MGGKQTEELVHIAYEKYEHYLVLSQKRYEHDFSIPLPVNLDGNPDMLSADLPENFPNLNRASEVLSYLEKGKTVCCVAVSGAGKVSFFF